MNKTLVIAAIAAVAVGGYVIKQQSSPAPYNVLDYVPADTPIFSGQLAPFPLKDYLASVPTNPNDQLALNDLYDENNPGLNFSLKLFKTYQEQLNDPDKLLKTFGLPDNLRAYFYTLGLFPVLKVEIENPQAFWELLDKNERETGFTHRQGTLQKLNYRAYPLTDANNPAHLELIFAIDKGLLTATINSAYNEQSLLENALGLTKAKNSLAASGKIAQIIKTHHLKEASVSFINHIELVKGLTTKDGNQLAKQISQLEKQLNKTSPFATIRTSECATDFASIAKNWPQTVIGYTGLKIDATQSTQEITTVIESKNQPILNALQAIRGYIPEYTANIENNVFTMGLGLNINQLTSSLTSIWHDLQTPSYSCRPLAQLQNQIAKSGESIGMLGMAASMANGIKGASIGILDYTMSSINNEPALKSLDALFTLSADDPQQIFNSIQMFSPELQQIQLGANSDPVNLNTIYPVPSELNLDPKLIIKDQHIVVYNGDKGKKAAQNLSSQPLKANGLYNLSFDFKKIFTPLATAMKLTGNEIPENLQFLADYDTRIKMNFDITPQGLTFNTYVNNKSAK